MRRMIMLTVWLVLSSPIVAEERSEEVPPLHPELVERLLSRQFGPVTLTVGAVPESLASEVPIPSGAEVDLTARNHRGNDLILLTVPGTAEAATEAIENELKKAGWEEAPHPEMVRGGFITAMNIRATGMCRKNQHLTIGLDRPRENEVPVAISINDAPGILCGQEERRPLRRDEIRIPYLYPPPGTRSEGSSMGGGGDQASSAVLMTTSLSIQDLMQHYHPQMIEQGWTSTDKVAATDASLHRYEKNDDGRDWIAILSAVKSGAEARHLGLVVVLERE